ncbi:alpha-(1,6)-fucosyltransferase isoform X1 [Odontomachus brunneus]|uniref:alpha-(1,6)-fucosyltransferase isoform X1 n=2 Tax=Odontomachus brunneus TaxID=486640 RepID=UPI0013F231ED|nr:alpha-(1,6)-fucosyltransferase isoform X1 [Odontomachus brunneus]XP_032682700.1 alpha-(1,6)-fucosyltransferase isoform X1 [Odontomachus brunneus]XP_032682701.1 alpha-(1,6)-fucosyltransferase isoform X1 [Odontomachus brunneus]XP_032682702.1 alpha-(1,6)-fucosyltransferase isoform X1 [Odontomachus brunneus]XP_032682703.1 alpha-(1,6)-fucosyltransferase isoform X1 [Odontomachus brunneus]
MAAIWSGRLGWLGKIVIALLATWLIALIVSISHIFKSNISSSQDANTANKVNTQRLAKMVNDFEILKKQNDALKTFILGEGSKAMQGDHLGSIQDRLEKASAYYDLAEQVDRPKHGVPSLEYEELQRRVRNDIQEMWYYIAAELNKFKKNIDDFTHDQKEKEKEIQDVLKNVWEHKKSLIMSVDRMTKADGYNEWREKEAKDLSDLVQRRFRYLQNPADCNKARKLVCSLNKGCGFGCQLHHITYCFMVAYGTERTLIIKSKGWRYHKDGWESVFKPLSDTCVSTSGISHSNWPGDPTKQVISLPIVDNVYPKPKYQAPSVPADLATRLEKIHGHPLVWWVGQVLKYLMRPQDHVKKTLDEAKERLGFKKPIVGIHVRRTDKVGTEAAYHDIDEYMTKVDQYFDELETKPDVRRVFLASDDPKVITTARKNYPNYEIIGDPEIAETASVAKRYSDTSLQGIIMDIHLLSECDYLVCTFSSQVCRVAYELMQTFYTDAYNKFTSLDDIYYYGGQNPHPHVAIMDHKPRKNGELELKIGDLIDVYGNHWDGFSKGYNSRTSMTGLFPSFKVKNRIAAVDFPKYPSVPLLENKTD